MSFAYFSVINLNTGDLKVYNYRSSEPAYVEQVKILGDDLGNEELKRVCVILRVVVSIPLSGCFKST